jgi:hypothetical protein
LVQSQNQFYNDLAKQNLIGNAYNQAYNTANTNMQQAAQLGMQGAQVGLGGQNAANAAYQTGLQGTAQGMQGSQIGLSGVNTAMQGQQLGLAGLQQAGNLYGQGMTGAQIGLQGVGAQQAGYAGANQAASTLGQLGQTQFGQQQAINNDILRSGAVQQAQQQQGLDVQYQDYLKQKNYPYQQLAFQSDMLRGLPLQQTTGSTYAAPPNAASQIGGLGMTALGVYGMSGGFKPAAKGGLMQSYAKGGQVGYASGGDISMLSTKQLMEMLDNPTLKPIERDMIEEQLMLRRRMESNPETSKIMAPTERSGLGAISTGDMVPEEGMAGGGIVAFADRGLVRPEKQMDYTDLIRERLSKMDEGNPFTKSDEQAQAIRQSMEERKQRSPYEALAMAGLGTMAGTSPYALTNLGLGGIEGLKSYGKSQSENAADQKLLLQQQVEADKARDARYNQTTNTMMTAQGHLDTKALGLLNAKNAAGANATAKQTAALIQAQNSWNQALDNAKDTLLKQTKFSSLYRNDPAAFNRAAKQEAMGSMSAPVLEILGMKPIADTSAPPPVVKPGAAKNSFPVPPAAAISALKSSKDQAKASQQFDDVFGPGAAQKALGK